ncbi:MAG TPA: NUDIX domain-containing protein [Candidatus Paceibacterota bacterium]|nr:NUDIX domain-containing protein [Candidatus Paceibacterota bacterium]
MLAELEMISDAQTCSAAIFIRDGAILLGLRNYIRHDEWKTVPLWTTPGGRCNIGESVGNGLLREIHEETGMKDIEIHSYIGNYPGAKAGDIVHVFVCESPNEPALMEPDKFSEWQWHPISDLPVNVISPHLPLILERTIAALERKYEI